MQMEMYPAKEANKAKKAIAFISILILFLFPTSLFCEVQTITDTIKQPFFGQFLKDGIPIPLKLILSAGMDLTDYMKGGG